MIAAAGEPRAYPLFLRLAGVRVLVVGGGPVAAEKAAALAAAGALVRVVAPVVAPAIEPVADDVQRRAFRDDDVDEAWLVVSAAPPDVNRAVRAAADARRRFVVAVDDVAHCSAIGASSFERGGVTIALSSDGRAPALVALLRRAIEAVLSDDLAAWAQTAAHERAAWKAARIPMAERRPLLLRALNALYDGRSP